jgi:hypothetical protein
MWEETVWNGIPMRVVDMEAGMDCLNGRIAHLEKHLPENVEKAFETKISQIHAENPQLRHTCKRG